MPPDTAHGDSPAAFDDLTRIEGIGPKIARQLNNAGIRTFEELASRSTRDIVGLIPGIARIPSARPALWRSQARKLAAVSRAQTAVAGPGSDWAAAPSPAQPAGTAPAEGLAVAGTVTTAADDSQHYESFGVTVLVDEAGSIRDTRMEHLRTGEVRRWAGWVPDAMLEFVMRANPRAEAVRERGDVPAEVVAEGDAHGTSLAPVPGRGPDTPGAPVAATSEEAGGAAPAGILSAGLSIERGVLRAGQPFTVTVGLDLTGASVRADRLVYNAVVEARQLGAKTKRAVAHVEGFLVASETPEITVEAAALPPGAYRLLGAVSLREPGSTRPGGLAAVAEGLTIQVLAA